MRLGLTSCYVLHMRYINLDDGYKTRVVFLDISEAFDNVWHEGLPHKLKENNISSKFQNTVKDFLYQRKKRCCSKRAILLMGCGWRGSFTRFYTWNIYINNLSDLLPSNSDLFGNDTSLFYVAENMTKSANELKNGLVNISTWLFHWKKDFNPDPTKWHKRLSLVQNFEVSITHVWFSIIYSPFNWNQKHHGAVLDSRLDFMENQEMIFDKVSKTKGIIRKF